MTWLMPVLSDKPLCVVQTVQLTWRTHASRQAFILCGAQVPLVSVMAFLVGRQAFCIAGNLTINELLNSYRYEYMRRDDSSFYNRFDRGPVTNCLQFWSSKAVPWDEVFHEERLVS